MSEAGSAQPISLDSLAFDDRGLLPVVVQDRLTGEIRMVAWANREAIRATLETGRATFWSRSRGELWEKGRTSGNPVQVARVLVDCDADCLIYSGEPEGPSCHTGAESCFFRDLAEHRATRSTPTGAPESDGAAPADGVATGQALLVTLESVLEARKTATGAKSYTKSLYEQAPEAIGRKLREEAGELADAVAAESDDRVISEAADTLYHLLVALRWRNIRVRSVLAALARRLGTSGHVEKASRPRTQA